MMNKRRRLSVEEKIDVIEFARTSTIQMACDRFGVSRSSVHAWSIQEPQLRQLHPSTKRVSATRNTGCSNSIPGAGDKAADHLGPESSAMMEVASTHLVQNPTATNSTSDHGSTSSPIPSSGDEAPPPQYRATGSASVAASLPGQERMAVGTSSRPILVGVQGEQGGFASIAAHRAFADLIAIDTFPVSAFEVTGYPQAVQMLEELSKGEITYAIIATESLLSTTTRVALDRLVALKLKIVGEVASDEHVRVCALPGTKLRVADCVMSDWYLLSRFEEYILQLEGLSKQTIYRHVAWDSATACRIVHEEQAENTLVLCSEEAAIANGLSVLVDRADCRHTQSKYTVIGRCDTTPLPFDQLSTRASESARRWHWALLLFSESQPNWVAIIQAIGHLNVTIEHLSIRNNGDEPERSGQTCVVLFHNTSGSIDDTTFCAAMAAMSVCILHLGKYTTHHVHGW